MWNKLIQNYRWEISIALITLLTNVVCFVFFVSLQNGDVLSAVRVDDGFYELAENVLAGNGFSWSQEAPYQPNTMRTPGYVWLLAGLISIFGVTGAAIVQILFSTTIPLLGMAISKTITESKTIGILTGFILALDPTLTQLSFQFYTESFFIIFFLSWLFFTLKYFKKPALFLLIIGAVLFGSSILIRASIQYLPLILFPLILWVHGKKSWRQAFAHICIFIAIVGTILAPWVVRNIQTFDAAALSTQSTFVLYTNFAVAVKTVAEGHDFVTFRDSFLTQEEFKGDAITFQNQNNYKEEAINIILEHPTASAFVIGKSLSTFFTSDGFYTLLTRVGLNPYDYIIFLILVRLVWTGITGVAFVGACLHLITKFTPQTFLVTSLVAYFALTSTVAAFGTNPRYSLPVDPIIISFAYVGGMFTYYFFIERIAPILKERFFK